MQRSYVYIVKYAEREAFQNDRVETTNSKYRLAFNILILVVRKGHRCLIKNLYVQFAGLLSAYDLLLPPTIKRLT